MSERKRKLPFDVSSVRDKHAADSARFIAPEQNGAGPRIDLERELEPYRLYDLAQLKSLPRTSWLIPQKLARGELTGLYGMSDSYKSFTALDWALTLAAAGHTVIYIAAEGTSGLAARIEAWKRARHVDGDLPGFRVMPANVNLHNLASVDVWIEAVRAQVRDVDDLALVVVDTLARNFVGGNENSAQDLGLFVEGCERIRRELETAVLVIHHTGKDGERERGAEALRNASFAMFKMTKQGGSGRSVKLECDRVKEAEKPAPETLRFKVVDLPHMVGEDGEEVTSLAPKETLALDSTRDSTRAEDALSTPERAVLKLLRVESGSNRGSNPLALRERLGWSKRKVAEALKSLETKGFVAAEGSTRNRVYVVVKEDE